MEVETMKLLEARHWGALIGSVEGRAGLAMPIMVPTMAMTMANSPKMLLAVFLLPHGHDYGCSRDNYRSDPEHD